MSNDDRWIPVDPAIRTGMYQSLDQVPAHLRLEVYEQEFKDRDVWKEFLSVQSWMDESHSENRRRYLMRAESRWKSFIEAREHHHALCTPCDAEEYAQELLEQYAVSLETAAKYWGDIERFYRWLFNHADYPHRYHPFVMAAATYERSREFWELSIDR